MPRQELFAEGLDVGKQSKRVKAMYEEIVAAGKNEFNILLNLSSDELRQIAKPLVAEAIVRVREGKLEVIPGYDGVYGQIKIFSERERKAAEQAKLF